MKKLSVKEIAGMYGESEKTVRKRLVGMGSAIERRKVDAPQMRNVCVYSEKDILRIFGELPGGEK